MVESSNSNNYVSTESAKNLCTRLYIENCIETSAINNTNIENAFVLLIKQILKRKNAGPFYG